MKALDDGDTLNNVSAQFGIPISTLSDKRADRHPRRSGGQPALSMAEEETIAQNAATLADWGFPLDMLDIRMMVRDYLQTRNKTVPIFVNNIPGKEWVRSFLVRQSHIISDRLCRNICRKRGYLSPAVVSSYFSNLEVTLTGVPPTHIINFDETNLTDDPGQKHCIVRRQCKYPERIMNSTKAATSLMFACSASGQLLHPYVVYKAQHLHDLWIQGGAQHARYNISSSGWFDSRCFSDWFVSVVIPFCRRLSAGKKVLIGDNLSSHFTLEVIAQCAAHDIHFVCLPPNTTHLCQPLDVAFFAPLKKHWREILTRWKQHEGRQLPVLPKESFPQLLASLLEALQPELKKNINSGFRKCGIVPLNRDVVLQRIVHSSAEASAEEGAIQQAVSAVVLNRLNEIHQHNAATSKQRKRRLDIVPGRSISLDDFQQHASTAQHGSLNAVDGSGNASEMNLLIR